MFLGFVMRSLSINFTPYTQNSKLIKQVEHPKPFKHGLQMITGIHGDSHGGTSCDGALYLSDFWSIFDKSTIKSVKLKGLATNTDAYPNSYLKAKANVPLSTSGVYDCSVMYLYNEKTKTHALYHAEHKIAKKELDKVLKFLMPEGITHGIIIPGTAHWYKRHGNNLHNMFEVMKKYNKNAIVNVMTDSTPLPEIVGYNGRAYQIKNRSKSNFPQASFKIQDLQGYDTFFIVRDIRSQKDANKLKHTFQNRGYNKETLNILNRKVDKHMNIINDILNCKSYEELDEYMECLDSDNVFVTFSFVFQKALKKLQRIFDK